MSAHTRTDQRVLEALLDLDPPPERHIYPTGGRRPVPGDRAWCGHVKRKPTAFATEDEARASGWPLCAACIRERDR